MVSIWVEKADRWWFGVACHEERLVATATGTGPDDAATVVNRCIPRGLLRERGEQGTAYARSIVRLLARLEAGADETPVFELCPDCVHEPLASILCAAALIPRGYVASYGAIAAAAHTEARVVGHVMANNPLYPIVPCHRVVGADMSLVGYTGRQSAQALRAKLDRLRAEARGYEEPTTIEEAGLIVSPAERVIEKAAREGIDPGVQLSLW